MNELVIAVIISITAIYLALSFVIPYGTDPY